MSCVTFALCMTFDLSEDVNSHKATQIHTLLWVNGGQMLILVN